MTRTELEALKTQVDLVAVIRAGGVELKKNGKNLKGRCPFHPDDDTPSLTVNPQAQLWNCFGCEAGGDVFRFLQLKEELTFPQALERVQGLAGLAPAENGYPKPIPELPAPYSRGALLGRVADYYAQRLREHPEAQQYLTSRGLDSKELWDAFGVGFADGSLLRTLPSSGELRQALTQLGVLTAEGKEHFRGCVVVPLTHPEEGVVGLYGRRIRPDAQVKHLYLPGPQRGVLNWQALKLSPAVVVAESVLDGLSLWRAGVLEATCLFGAARFPEDLHELLGRYGTKEVVFCLDADRAGREARERLAGPLAARGIRVLAVTLPEGKDPNQLLCEAGPEALKERVRHRQPLDGAPEPARPAAPALESTDQGVQLECGGVRYRMTLKLPLTRLKVNLRGVRGAQLYMDTVDLLSQRDRARAQKQLSLTFEISRLDAEQHMAALIEAAELWVEERQREAQTQAEAEAQDFEPMTEREREVALAFLRQPDLIEQILADMAELGYVGEENAKLLGYLIGLSRKLHSPLSGVVRSQSGAGKSALTELVEELTPPDEVIHYSRLSPQALYWMARNCLKHKLLILEERVGAEAADYSIRVLQSKQQLSQAAVIKDATGKLATKTFVVEGPIAYLETTTNLTLNHENATRCFEIALDESAEQTRRIQEAQRASRLPSRRDRHLHREAVRRRHHCAQKLLEPVLIFVPYVEQLTFPSRWLRTRRDHERFLCLLEAVAFLHQHQRERGTTEDGTPYLLATLADYALTYRLAKDVLASTLHELSRDAQELWLAIRAWAEEQPGPGHPLFTRRLLRQVTHTEDHRLRATLEELVEMEYVQAVSGSKGRAFEYRLLVLREAEAPSALRELLTPEELARRWQPGAGPG